MKILIRASSFVEQVLQQGAYPAHCSFYYPFLFLESFRRLGHQSQFYFVRPLTTDTVVDSRDWDVMLWWGLESLLYASEADTILRQHSGKHVLVLTTYPDHPLCQRDLMRRFDHFVFTDCVQYVERARKVYPDIRTTLVSFAAPLPDFIDRDVTNPFGDGGFKIIYTGMLYPRYLSSLNRLAETGLDIYVGGTFTGRCDLLHPRVRLINPDVAFHYGEHFRWLRHASVGLNYYPAPNAGAVSSKLVDYLVCGLPVISEEPAPNNFVIPVMEAGRQVPWGDFDALVHAVEEERGTKRDRRRILSQARERFDPLKVCSAIIAALES